MEAERPISKYVRSTKKNPWRKRLHAVRARINDGMSREDALAIEQCSLQTYYRWWRDEKARIAKKEEERAKARSAGTLKGNDAYAEANVTPTVVKRPAVMGRLDYDPREFKNLQNDYDDLDRDYQDLLDKHEALKKWKLEVQMNLLDIVPILSRREPLSGDDVKVVLEHMVLTFKSPE
jgi:hypothetical protein